LDEIPLGIEGSPIKHCFLIGNPIPNDLIIETIARYR
jgi:hypothetical protein